MRYRLPPSILIEGFHGAICPVCSKIISDWETGAMLLCEHVLALHLDLTDCQSVHPAYSALHEDQQADSWTDDWVLESLTEGDDFADLDPKQLDPGRDRFLIDESWSAVQFEQTGMGGPFGSTWTVWVAWPNALLDPNLPDGGVQQRLDRVREAMEPIIGAGRVANDWPRELLPPEWRGEGVVLES
jgi:hypothetical protein